MLPQPTYIRKSIAHVILRLALSMFYCMLLPVIAAASTRSNWGSSDDDGWILGYPVVLIMLSFLNLALRWRGLQILCFLMLIPVVLIGVLLLMIPPVGIIVLICCLGLGLVINESMVEKKEPHNF